MASYRFKGISICLEIKQACPSFAFTLVVMAYEILLCMTGHLGRSSGRDIVFRNPTPVSLKVAVKQLLCATRVRTRFHDGRQIAERYPPFPTYLTRQEKPYAPLPSKEYLHGR